MIAVFHAGDYRTRPLARRVLARTVHVCNGPEGVRETLHRQHDTFERKTSQQRRALAPLLGDGLFVSDGETWAERRAAVAPIVHGRHVERFIPVMREVVDEWCGHWREAGDRARLDVLFEMGELTAEIISRTIFGRRLGRAFTAEIIAGFAEYQRRSDKLDLLNVLGLPDGFPRPSLGRTRAARRRVHAVIDDIIDRHAAGEGDGGALIAQLFEARDANGKPLTRRAIRNEAIVIFMAGHETTANTLAWAFYLVSQSPRVAARLEEEFRTVLAGRIPGPEDVPRLAYTRAVIEETLRLYPPVPFLGRTAKREGTVSGRHLREGDILVVCPWLIHRNRDVYEMPDHFMPERFLADVAERPSKYAYIPFASGPRVCPGLTFAMTEAVICLAGLRQAFDVSLAEGTTVQTDCRLTLRPTSPLTMVVQRRLADAVG
jgi:cytochrome P450